MSINISEEAAKADSGVSSAQTLDQLDEVIERYKATNPAKYALKVASGEFARLRAALSVSTPASPSTEEALGGAKKPRAKKTSEEEVK